MKKWAIGYAAFTVVWISIVLLRTILSPGRGTWPDWIAAFGTLAAFAGTIHLATSETAKRNADADVNATIHAISLNSRASIALRELQTLLTDIEKQKAFFGFMSFKDARDLLARHRYLWTVPEMAAIVPLDRNCAQSMAQAQSAIEIAFSTCTEVALFTMDVNQSLEITAKVEQIVRHSHKRLEYVFSVLNEEAKKHFTLAD
jgi:hypothetical protein